MAAEHRISGRWPPQIASIFYLVIDKQKTSENVYFLNAVTVDDLLPLAEQGEEPAEEVTPEPEPEPCKCQALFYIVR